MTTIKAQQLADDLARDKARAAELIGDAIICAYCGATLATYETRCSAAYDVECPGDEAYRTALAEASRERREAA